MSAGLDKPAAAQTTVAGHRLDPQAIPLLITLGLGVFAGALDLGVLSPALPALAVSFGVDSRAIAWIFTIPAAGLMAALLFGIIQKGFHVVP